MSESGGFDDGNTEEEPNAGDKSMEMASANKVADSMEEIPKPLTQVNNDYTNKVEIGLRTLIDSDSEEEEEVGETWSSPVKDKVSKQQKEHGEFPKRKVSIRASKKEAMKQIQSETQRLVRETEISLPYHRPKQRTLQEFLSRKKVLSILPKAPTMAAKLKMSSAIVDKLLKEKEKEAEMFYKSSDSEEETTESRSENDKESTNGEYIQKFKKVIAPKKLFACDSLHVSDKEEDNTDLVHEINESITKTNETKHNLLMEIDASQMGKSWDDSAILKSNLGTVSTENANVDETIANANEIEGFNKVGDALLQEEIIENEDEERNTMKRSSDGIYGNEKNNLQTDDDSSNGSSSNINDYAKMVKQSLGIVAEESDEYNEYGLPPPKLDITPNINEKKALSSMQSVTPKLRGAPGTVIDLTDDMKPNKKAINALIDRFVYKHSKINNEISGTSKVTVTQMIESPDGSSIKIEETLPYKLQNSEKVDPKLKKPGAKLLRLKQELEEKMALKREEEWKEKEQEMKEYDIEWNETLDKGDHCSKLYSPSIATCESEEDEFSEDDICEKKEKKRSKCEFLDDEADVSDNEVDDEDGIIDEGEDENSETDEERLILEDDEDSTCGDSVDVKRKPFKRIVEPVEDDSRSCDTSNNDDAAANRDNKICSSPTTIHSDMFHSDNERDIPVSQTRVKSDLEHKLNQQTPLTKKTEYYSFVSPATQLTALSTCLEDKKEIEQESVEPDLNLMESPRIGDLSQGSDSISRATVHKKLLFTDQNDIMEDELMELCSGKFMTNKNSLDFSKLSNATGSQLLDSVPSIKNSQESETDAIHERLKGNYESREKSSVLSSDENEDENQMVQKVSNRSKKKVKKLELSDDEEENECLVSSDDDDDQSERDEDKFIDYDSEENEVVVPKKNIKQYAATFLENEAELSESDCDVSADEDEDDLDNLELEDGDDEDIDETQVKNQLGKLHMKQMLDEDQKEVRMLKELLFEEGDLFSESARERKFKWKNINKQDDNDQSQPSEDKDGWVDLSDEEDEAKWRKMRHEREKFLAEKMISVDTEIENDLNNSQIFKFGMKILKKRRTNESQIENTMLDLPVSEAARRIPHTIADMLNTSNLEGKSRVIHNVMQKRSILARGEKSLARLAALARQKDVPLSSINAKSFVFAHIDPSAEDTNTDSALRTETQRYKVKRKA
ncbi:uncharacterized protein LOC143215936 [Lasioglossum baleicum]|uniref:uncharacterized protein LOC143215936 n=1 Tax=Lasioglossum baleicum TaxID=434251 RepID=UPI003FCEAAAE